MDHGHGHGDVSEEGKDAANHAMGHERRRRRHRKRRTEKGAVDHPMLALGQAFGQARAAAEEGTKFN